MSKRSILPESPFDPSRSLETARTLPSKCYTSAEIFDYERSHVFSRCWQYVGRSKQVEFAGQYITCELLGEPILVIRGDDGQLRGFFNVCRHRAAPLLTDECGSVNKLRCKYHGWTYDLTGRLRGTPEFEGVCEFNKEDHGVTPVGGIAEWGGFVWLHLQIPSEPLSTFLSPLPEWTVKRDAFKGLVHMARTDYELECNWKVYVDNYLDGGYHVNSIHPSLSNVLDYREYTTQTWNHVSLQSAPLKPAEGATGLTRTGDIAAYWWIYPNFMINVYSGVMDTNLVLPLGHDRCRVIFDYYFTEGTQDSFVQQSVKVADQVQIEDIQICEQVQRGLMSQSYDVGRFSVKRENGGYHFHQLLGRALLGN